MELSKSNSVDKCIFVHIEKYTSTSSSKSKVHLSQVAATAVTKKEFLKGSLGRDSFDGSNFFIPVKPSDSFAKILDTHKWSGDVLQALHINKEDNGDFLFRKQIEVTSKKIQCRSEKTTLSKFCDFFREQQPAYIMSSDKENLRILISKCREIIPEKFNELRIKGYTSWKRSLKDFDQPDCDLEEFYLKTTNNNVVQHPSAQDVVGMLKFCYLSLVNTRKQILKKAETISLKKLTKVLDELGKPTQKLPHTSEKGQVVLELASGTSKLSSSFFGRKLEQIVLESDSEDEVRILDFPQPKSEPNQDFVVLEEAKENEYIEHVDNKEKVKAETSYATSCIKAVKRIAKDQKSQDESCFKVDERDIKVKTSRARSCIEDDGLKPKVKVQNLADDDLKTTVIEDVKPLTPSYDYETDEDHEDDVECVDLTTGDSDQQNCHNEDDQKMKSWNRRFPDSSSDDDIEEVPEEEMMWNNNPQPKSENSLSKFNMTRKKRKVDGKTLIRCNLCEDRWFPEEELYEHFRTSHLAGVWSRQKFPGTAAIVCVGDGAWECDICHQEHLDLESGSLSHMRIHLEAFHGIKDVTKFLQIRGIKMKLSESEINQRKQEQAMRKYSIPKKGETTDDGSKGVPKKKKSGPRPSWMKALHKSVWW